MSTLEIAAEINNIGASMLEAGRHHDAILLFRHALDAKMRQMKNGGTSTRNIEEEEADAHRVACAYEQLNRIQGRQNSDEPQRDLQQHTAFYIYAQPMTIAPPLEFNESPEQCLNEKNSLPSVAFDCAIIMFNIALVHHIRGIEQHLNRSCMEKAVKLYCMSHQFFRELVTRYSIADGDTFLPLAVLLNNLGEIYHELGEYEESRKHLSRLNHIMGGSRSLPFATSNLLVSERDWNGMLFNAKMLTEPNLASAA